MEVNERVLGFIAEWFDPHPQLLKRYLLKYYCETREVEMKDLSTNRKFLKKTKVPPSIKESDFFVDANILLLSRDLKLIDYADPVTRRLLEDVDERTVCVLSPALYDCMGQIVMLIEHAGFTLVDLKSARLQDFKELEEAAYLVNTAIEASDLMRPEPLVAMSFRGANSVEAVHMVIESSSYAGMGVACPSNADEASDLANFFLKQRPTTAALEQCTCCVIKPHAISDRMVGMIVDDVVSRGFVVSAMQVFRLERAAAAEFLEVYDGVIPEYNDMVDELCSGPVLAMEVSHKQDAGTSLALKLSDPVKPGDTVVEIFRDHAGPWDVHMAKEMFSGTIRGKFGRDRIRNAIHCTDIPKDGVTEVEYFFRIMTSLHYIDG